MLIDETGSNLGKVESKKALALAKEKGLDLILVNKSATPPVCRLGDLGKLEYEAKKHKKDTKIKVQELKTLKIRPCTQQHDLLIEVRQAEKFLKEGHKVKIECRFRNRELKHPKLGETNINFILSQLGEYKIDKELKLEARSMIVIIAPK